MSNKQRLLELISQREKMCTEPIDYDHIYAWLEEIHYLFGELASSSSIAPSIRSIIQQIFFFSNDRSLLEKNIVLVKAKLTVFEKYEAEKLANN